MCYSYCSAYDNKKIPEECDEEENREAAEDVTIPCVKD
jgi:hypothetical protein